MIIDFIAAVISILLIGVIVGPFAVAIWAVFKK